MSIFINGFNNNQTLLSFLFGKKTKIVHDSRNAVMGKRDIAIVSNAGQREVAIKKATSGKSHNRRIDASIDLQSYIVAAQSSNQGAIASAGNAIDSKMVPYTSTGKAFRTALTEKYSKLVAEAKTYSDPEDYIYQKYYCKGSQYYESDLDKTERQIAYNYEIQMYKTGKINGVSYRDSLFRGIEVKGDAVDSDKIQFERQVINSQISNILQQSGINRDAISESYEISVEGAELDTKVKMETALNVGDNGKNLYLHIYKCSTQDGCNSTQVSSTAYMKYQAYQQVYTYTGLKINELFEKSGTYYTKDGKDVLDIVDSAISKSGEVPNDFKAQTKAWIHELVSGISSIGWNNVSDMKLSILFNLSGLKDIHQSINFQYDAESTNRQSKQWYQVM